MEQESLLIRRATPADEPATLELLRLSMGEDSISWTPEFWRWKHASNPFGSSLVLLAEDARRVVGLRAFMRWSWQSGGHQVMAVRAVDTATHPDYRGRSIFRRLTLHLRDEVEQEGVAFIYNTPNTQSRPGYLKMGWLPVGKPTLWARPVRAVRLARALRREGIGGAEGEPPRIEAPSVGEVLARPGVHALIESAAESVILALHTPTSVDYLRWRYADVPGINYQALSEGDGADGAMLILRSRRRGALREIRLCEIIFGPTRAARNAVRSLLRRAPGLGDVDVVLAMDAGRPGLGKRMLASGFLPAPRSGPILTTFVFPSAGGLPDPRRLSSWGASIGDLELF